VLAQDRLDGIQRRRHVEKAFDFVLGQEQCQGASSLFTGGLSVKIAPLMRVLVIDNYDSFTYNLVQYLGELGAEVLVRRNDEVTPEEVSALHPDRIVVSPGPCTPNEAGVSVRLIQEVGERIPTLGVCLGHQSIGQAFGAEVVRGEPVHGKTARIMHDGREVYKGLAQGFEATRYHSLVIEPESVPECLVVTSRTEDGTIMGVRHREYPVEGVQFHPESILTRSGHDLLKNFLGL
jgi:anthranilate synthase/aminodeoxychorismate synthase-like glutamine amidotransferase